MKIEFVEDTHTYLVDGVITPSVSDFINWAFPNNYANIPNAILDKKAKYGTRLHKEIENVLNGKKPKLENVDPNIKYAVLDFIKNNKKWNIKAKAIESMGTYKGLICGTCDIIDEHDYITDIKSTSELKINNETCYAPLNLQIATYYLIHGIYKKNGYVLWIPKGQPQEYKEVKCMAKKDLIKLLEQFIKDWREQNED